jgi:hypothetical protein
MADNEGRVESIDHLVHSVTEDSANLVDESVRKRKKSRTSPDHSFKEEENNVKKHKPYDNRWIQQKMPACRPIWHPVHVVILFIVTGFLFVVLGIAFIFTSLNTREVSIDYTQCEWILDNAVTCEQYIRINIANGSKPYPTCTCRVIFNVTQELRPPVNVYYGLSNYYQNHRRYVQSWSVTQINAQSNNDLRETANCEPMRNSSNANGTSVPIAPCGLRMNSAFNDTFTLLDVFINQSNISWPVDRSVRFSRLNVTSDSLAGTVRPPNWPRPLSEVPDGLQNEHNIVWFRASALPWLRKLYGRIHTSIPAGRHTVDIQYNYLVTRFSGKKHFILSEVSWLGGQNYFLGGAYVLVGLLSVAGGIIVMVVHFKCSKWKDSDEHYKDIISGHM